MTYTEITEGIKEYNKSFQEKNFSKETEKLKNQYIEPILTIAANMYKKELPNALFTSAFFLGDRIKVRAGMRIDGKYTEIDKFYLTKCIIKNNFKKEDV